MKKFAKVCLIICLVFLGIGAVCAGVGVAMGSGFDEVRTMVRNGEFSIGGRYLYFNDYEKNTTVIDAEEESSSSFSGSNDSVNYTSGSYAADGVTSLDIDVIYGKVEFVDSDTDQIEISIDAPLNHTYTCENKNGTLRLKETSKDIWGNEKKIYVSVAIPAGKIFKDVTIVSNAGEITIDHIFSAEEINLDLDAGKMEATELIASDSLDINVDAGSIVVKKMQVKESEISCGTGEIKVSGRVDGDISVNCGIGRITLELEGNAEQYNYEIHRGVGGVNINGEHYSSYLRGHENNFDKDYDDDDSGDEYRNIGAVWDMELECGIGQIDVTFL